MKLTVASALLGAILGLTSHAADLPEADKEFLARYEKVRAALAADNLRDAKIAAAELKEEGAPLAGTNSLILARREFEKLSAHAISVAKGQSGYYVAYCPMLKKDWVQTNRQISNPYAGREMLVCGTIKEGK